MATARGTKTRARADATKRSLKTRASSASARCASSKPRKPRASQARRATRAERRLATFILVTTLIVATWVLYPVMKIEYQQQRQKQTLEQRLAALKERNEQLRKKAQRLQTPEGVEEAARESLGLTRPGEQVYVVTESEPTASPVPDVFEQTRSIDVEDSSVVTAILDAIFGVK